MRPNVDPIPGQTIDRAAQWFLAMRESVISPQEREAFAEWLKVSPVNVRAYLEVAGMWEEVSHVGDVSLDDLSDAQTVVSLNAANPAVRGQTSRKSRFSSWALRAACAVLALTGAVLWWNTGRDPVYTAGIGEQRTITLDDGSVVRLNSRSRVRVSLSETRRDFDLLAGQALFEVAKDPRKPFIVHSGDVSIRALGTAFDVYRRKAGTVVTVVEGVVAVKDTRLIAGQQLVISAAGALKQTPDPNIPAATSWLQQELIFTGEPLSAVVEEFNRYSRRSIVLADPALEDFRINAVFHSTNADSLLRFVRRMEGVTVEETNGKIRISRRHGQK